MEIKPPGAGGPLPPISPNNEPVRRLAKAARPETANIEPSGQSLKSITSECRKSDLQDPVKVEQILSRCTDELLQSALTRVDGKLPPEAGANLAEWMQNDPVLRGKLLNYLERVLP
jgi:hypothetical protein